MAESLILKRVIFPKGKQKMFISEAKRKLNLSYTSLARLLEINPKTLADWHREKFSISLKAFNVLLDGAAIKAPAGIKIKEPFWYVGKGARAGGVAVFEKYGRVGGNPDYRKKKWREWWGKEGRYKIGAFPNLPKPIKKPKFSKELAEFVGIMLGDGGIWQYQVYVTLHIKDDKEYSGFVVRLIRRLFNVPVKIFFREEDSTIKVMVFRKALVDFCVQRLGLRIGNKVRQRVDIPAWVKKNKEFSIACLRGLFDTDGSVFNHRYKANGKEYNYLKISFTSCSKPLLLSVAKILDSLEITANIRKNMKDIRIDGQGDVKKYFQIVGFNNPKYLKKYQK